MHLRVGARGDGMSEVEHLLGERSEVHWNKNESNDDVHLALRCSSSLTPCQRNAGHVGQGPPSLRVEPEGFVATTRRYIRDLIYGANDGVITTFPVVAGVTGGALFSRAVLVVGAANLLA